MAYHGGEARLVTSAAARNDGDLAGSIAGSAVDDLVGGVEGERRIRVSETPESRVDEEGGVVNEVLGRHVEGS